MNLAVNLNINGAIFPDVESHLSTIKILIQTSPAPEDLGDAQDPYFIHLEDSEERRVCVLVLLSLKNSWVRGFIQTLFWGDCACFVRQRD